MSQSESTTDRSGTVARRTALLSAAATVMLVPRPSPAQSRSPAKSAESPAPTPAERDALADLVTQDLLYDAASPVLGNPAGEVTMIEFFDYRCPYCKLMAPKLVTLIGKEPRLRLVMKEYPILGSPSIVAAKVALVAARHGKFAPFHAAMYALSGPLDQPKVMEVAQSIGLDPATVGDQMNDDALIAELRRNLALGEIVGAKGTPVFIIDGQAIPGAVPLDVLEEMIDASAKSRKKGKANATER